MFTSSHSGVLLQRFWPRLPGQLGAVAFVAAVFTLDRTGVWLTFLNAPPAWLLVVALVGIAVGRSRSIWWTVSFVFAGLVTLPYSLAPGHTLVAFLWEATYLAAAAVMVPRWARTALLAVLSWRGFTHMSALALVGGGIEPTLVSYAYGGVAAGLLFPAIVLAARAADDRRATSGRRVGGVLLGVLLASMALFVALASGSRAIYLALALAGTVFAVRALRARLLLPGLVVVLAALAIALGYDAALPRSPIRTMAVPRLAGEQQLQDVTSSVDNVRWRLAMWRQSLVAVIDHPLGTGNGSFTSVVHAYQRYPMLWSTSPHSIAVETLMTGGVIRGLLLVILLSVALARAFRDEDEWPWSAAIVAVWVPLLFDVAASNPVYMSVAFAVTAGAAGKGPKSLWPTRVMIVAAVVSAVFWWYAPCDGRMCSLERHLGFTPAVERAIRGADDETARLLVLGASELYPRSVRWLSHEYVIEASGSDAWPSLVELFPFVSLVYYVSAVESLVALGECGRAIGVAEAGATNLGDYDALFGQARITRETHADLLGELHQAAHAVPCSIDLERSR